MQGLRHLEGIITKSAIDYLRTEMHEAHHLLVTGLDTSILREIQRQEEVSPTVWDRCANSQ